MSDCLACRASRATSLVYAGHGIPCTRPHAALPASSELARMSQPARHGIAAHATWNSMLPQSLPRAILPAFPQVRSLSPRALARARTLARRLAPTCPPTRTSRALTHAHASTHALLSTIAQASSTQPPRSPQRLPQAPVQRARTTRKVPMSKAA